MNECQTALQRIVTALDNWSGEEPSTSVLTQAIDKSRVLLNLVMSPVEFKHGMMWLARTEPKGPYDVVRAWGLVFSYIDADEDAKRDCSEMLREDLARVHDEQEPK